eukprot:Clim_evm27s246 gene=Clim_evmTU27s246
MPALGLDMRRGAPFGGTKAEYYDDDDIQAIIARFGRILETDVPSGTVARFEVDRDEALEAVRELERILKNDQPQTRVEALRCARTGVAYGDLMPMLHAVVTNSEHEDLGPESKLTFAVVRLLHRLTLPVGVLFETELEEMDKEDRNKEVMHNMREYANIMTRTYNILLCETFVLDLMTIIAPCLAKGVDAEERDNQLTGMVVQIFYHLTSSHFHRDSTQEKAIFVYDQTGVMDLLLALASEPDLELRLYVLKVVRALYGSVKPVDLANFKMRRAGNSNPFQEPGLRDSTLTVKKQKPPVASRRAGLSHRHGRFNGAFSIKTLEETRSANRLGTYGQIKHYNLDENKRLGRGRKQVYAVEEAIDYSKGLSDSAKQRLKATALQIIERSFNDLVGDISAAFRNPRYHDLMEETDNLNFLWMLWFFPAFQRTVRVAIRSSSDKDLATTDAAFNDIHVDDAIGRESVNEAMEIENFKKVMEYLKEAISDESIDKAHWKIYSPKKEAGSRVFNEYLLQLRDMIGQDGYEKAAKTLLLNVLHYEGTRSLPLMLLNDWRMDRQTLSQLHSLVYIIDNLLKLVKDLEAECKQNNERIFVSKKTRAGRATSKKKKQNLANDDGVNVVSDAEDDEDDDEEHQRETELHYREYFETFVHPKVIDKYMYLLKMYQHNPIDLDQIAARMIYNLSRVKGSMGIFYNLEYFVVFNNILQDPRSRKEGLKPLANVAKTIISSFFKEAQNNHFLFADLLFPNNTTDVKSMLRYDGQVFTVSDTKMRELVNKNREQPDIIAAIHNEVKEQVKDPQDIRAQLRAMGFLDENDELVVRHAQPRAKRGKRKEEKIDTAITDDQLDEEGTLCFQPLMTTEYEFNRTPWTKREDEHLRKEQESYEGLTQQFELLADGIPPRTPIDVLFRCLWLRLVPIRELGSLFRPDTVKVLASRYKDFRDSGGYDGESVLPSATQQEQSSGDEFSIKSAPKGKYTSSAIVVPEDEDEALSELLKAPTQPTVAVAKNHVKRLARGLLVDGLYADTTSDLNMMETCTWLVAEMESCLDMMPINEDYLLVPGDHCKDAQENEDFVELLLALGFHRKTLDLERSSNWCLRHYMKRQQLQTSIDTLKSTMARVAKAMQEQAMESDDEAAAIDSDNDLAVGASQAAKRKAKRKRVKEILESDDDDDDNDDESELDSEDAAIPTQADLLKGSQFAGHVSGSQWQDKIKVNKKPRSKKPKISASQVDDSDAEAGSDDDAVHEANDGNSSLNTSSASIATDELLGSSDEEL